jgi:hypothetical protein
MYFYICDRFGLPVEQWEEIHKWVNIHSEYQLLWRQTDYKPITQYNTTDRIPTTPPGGSISYDEPAGLI